jgi:hypothetical protein
MRERIDMAAPPRGWLKGVLLTIVVFWYSGVMWEAFTAHEISPLRLAGGGILIVGLALTAHQALTNDDYRTSNATRIGRVLIFLGVTVSVVAAGLN